MFPLNSHPDCLQPVGVFLEGLNWDNRPLPPAMADFILLSAAGVPLTQSVGQFWAALNWSGSQLHPELMPELPPEDPFTLDDFAALFGGAFF